MGMRRGKNKEGRGIRWVQSGWVLKSRHFKTRQNKNNKIIGKEGWMRRRTNIVQELDKEKKMGSIQKEMEWWRMELVCEKEVENGDWERVSVSQTEGWEAGRERRALIKDCHTARYPPFSTHLLRLSDRSMNGIEEMRRRRRRLIPQMREDSHGNQLEYPK